MYIFKKQCLLSFGLFLTLSACGGGEGSPTEPTVSSTTPVDSTTSVARNTTINAIFNEDMFAATVNATSFTLAKSGAVDGTATFDATANAATFTPDNELAILSTYTATLSTAITNLSGNSLAADYSWSFTTAEGTWGDPELIETDNTGDARNPQVAIDSSGNAIMVWYQNNGAIRNIWANRFDGTSWGTPDLLETDSVENAFSPRISFDSSGNAIAVWSQSDATVRNIWPNRFDGTSWGTAELIETNNAGNALSPQIAIGSDGNAIAVWYQSDGAARSIWANRFDGTNWSTAELIETDNVGHAYFPQVSLDNDGNAIAVWYQSEGAVNNIWTNRFDGTNWGTAALIEAEKGDAYEPQVSFDSSGNAIAVWIQSDGVRNDIWANRFDGTSWGTAKLIETKSLGGVDVPQISFDSSGNAIAVWQQSDGAVRNIWANRFK